MNPLDLMVRVTVWQAVSRIKEGRDMDSIRADCVRAYRRAIADYPDSLDPWQEEKWLGELMWALDQMEGAITS